MLQIVLNHDHLTNVLGEALIGCRHRLLIATANVKDLHVPVAMFDPGRPATQRPSAESIVQVFETLAERNIEIRLLHGGVPSEPFLRRLKQNLPPTLTMRRCPRMHVKTIIADGRWMYLGSANLTGAGLGAKSPRRRNFEAGLCTDDLALIDPVADMLDRVWNGQACEDCGRKDQCPVPLEEPQL